MLSKKIFIVTIALIFTIHLCFFIYHSLFLLKYSHDTNDVKDNSALLSPLNIVNIKNFTFQKSFEKFFITQSYQKIFFQQIYNEIFFRLIVFNRFNDNYLWDDEFGFIPIDSLLKIITEQKTIPSQKKIFFEASTKLKRVQEILEEFNTNLIVVLPPEKGRVYSKKTNHFFSLNSIEDVKYSNFLKDKGLNYIDTDLLNEKYSINNFFTRTGFHWSINAACYATKEIFELYDLLKNKSTVSIDCSNKDYLDAYSTDIDIKFMFPMFKDTIKDKSYYPIYKSDTYQIPKIILIGDSFTDQIIITLREILPKKYLLNNLTFYDYFQLEKKFKKDLHTFDFRKIDKKTNEVFSNIKNSDLVILVISDRNINRLGEFEFGFTDYILNLNN